MGHETDDSQEPADKLTELKKGDKVKIDNRNETYTVKTRNPFDVVLEGPDGTNYSLANLPTGPDRVTIEKIALGSDPVVISTLDVIQDE